MKRTIEELAAALRLDKVAADNLIKFLSACSPPLATFRGERPSVRGHGPAVYEIERGAGARVKRMLDSLEQAGW